MQTTYIPVIHEMCAQTQSRQAPPHVRKHNLMSMQGFTGPIEHHHLLMHIIRLEFCVAACPIKLLLLHILSSFLVSYCGICKYCVKQHRHLAMEQCCSWIRIKEKHFDEQSVQLYLKVYISFLHYNYSDANSGTCLMVLL